MTINQALLGTALNRARQYAAERAKKSVEWDRAFWAIEQALVERLYERWDGQTKPTRFLGKALRKMGIHEAIVEKALTAIGEALEDLTKKRELIVARGNDIVQWYARFYDIPGLRSCMAGKERELGLYTQHPDLVGLWVLQDEEGDVVARAIMWERVLIKVDGDFVEGKFLDRIYSVSRSAEERMLALAREAGAWTRTKQSFEDLNWDHPAVSPDGDRAIVIRAYLDWGAWDDPREKYWPYLDTLKYARFDDDGRFILASKPPKNGPYLRADGTNGVPSSYGGFWDVWEDRYRGERVASHRNRHAEEVDDEDGYRCDSCGQYVDENDVHFYGNYPYCPDCFYESYFYCDACGEAHSRGYGYRVDDYMYCEECFDRNYVVCERCGEVVDRGNVRWLDDEPYCEGCFDRVAASCDHCGGTFHAHDLHYLPYEEMRVCGDCFRRHTAACVMCGERILTTQRRGMYLVDTPIAVRESGIMGHVCNTCLDDLVQNRGYERCPGCERYVHPDHFHDGECDECRTVEEVAREVCGSDEEVEA